VTRPPTTVPSTGAVAVAMRTNRGTLTLRLDATAAPCTVASFLSLARQKFFDATPCHRLTTAGILVLQCGDPTGTGTGGPGYTIPDEVKAGQTYPAGTVAMANTGSPHTGGSQFFVVYADTDLPPQYTVFGTVTAGLDVVRTVARAGSDNSNGSGDGKPRLPVTIESVTEG
jgi:peptidyl-prolyl cis-trans isomerase B (cyclophilin B)